MKIYFLIMKGKRCKYLEPRDRVNMPVSGTFMQVCYLDEHHQKPPDTNWVNGHLKLQLWNRVRVSYLPAMMDQRQLYSDCMLRCLNEPLKILLRVSPIQEMGEHTKQKQTTTTTTTTTTTFLTSPAFTSAAITTIIIHDLLSSVLVFQFVEQRTIKFGGRGFVFRRGRRFSFSCVISHFLTRANAQWEIHGFTFN